jgi:hypothetical protein
VTLTNHTLRWLYLLGAALAMVCATTSAQHGAYWYAAGLAAVNVLLVTATVRDYIAADERRAVDVRAQRVARLRALADQREMRRDADALLINRACCEHWWTSGGCQHDSACTRKENSR